MVIDMFFNHLFARQHRLQRILILCFIVGFLVLIVYSIHKKSVARKADISTATGETAQLPPDVEFVLKDFRFSESSDAGAIDIYGKLSAMRGRKVMVFRSNIAKATYFELLNGTIQSQKSTISFSADYGEWDNQKTTPFIMNGNVRLTVDGKAVEDADTLRLDMAGRVLVATGKDNILMRYSY